MNNEKGSTRVIRRGSCQTLREKAGVGGGESTEGVAEIRGSCRSGQDWLVILIGNITRIQRKFATLQH